jgi:hypothetical protein
MSDSWIEAKPRIDEPSNEEVFVDHACWKVEVLLDTRKVSETNIKELDVFVLNELDDLGCGLEHWVNPFKKFVRIRGTSLGLQTKFTQRVWVCLAN